MIRLERLGWNTFWEQSFASMQSRGFVPGRVTAQHKNSYRVYLQGGELPARVTGKFLHESEQSGILPVVGDWAVIRISNDQNHASIHGILPRKSKFSRKIAGSVTREQVAAANNDLLFLVQGLDGDFNPRRMERYLVMAWDSGASPVIILSKMDLCTDVKQKLYETSSIAPGVPVHAISSVTQEGLEQLRNYTQKGKTIALLGSSGAGKSTLINRLLGNERQKIQEVRSSDSRGRHTTTRRELLLLPSGGCVIDTPGMRELQLWNAPEGMIGAFPEIAKVAARCRFDDCRHDAEPDCAVKQALSDSTLDPERFENFQKLRRELEYLNSRQDPLLQAKRKQKIRLIHRQLRKIPPKRS